MTYEIPSKVKIGCHTYQVVETPSVNKYIPRYGEIDYVANTIRIDSDIPADRKFETLWHEVIHGIEVFMDVELEEEQVKRLAHGIAMVLVDNPTLLKTSKKVDRDGPVVLKRWGDDEGGE